MSDELVVYQKLPFLLFSECLKSFFLTDVDHRRITSYLLTVITKAQPPHHNIVTHKVTTGIPVHHSHQLLQRSSVGQTWHLERAK